MKRVLVVDDERDIREALAELLSSEGYDVVSAGDGREGLECLRELHPNVVVLDLMMPGMNGWQFRAVQLEDPELSRIPVIVVSAMGRDPELKAQSSFEKPFDIKDLLAEVHRLALAA